MIRLAWIAAPLLLVGLASCALARLSSDITSLLPRDASSLSRDFQFFSDQGAVRLLAITAEGPGGDVALRALIPLLAPLGATPVLSSDPSAAARTAAVALDQVAVLVSPTLIEARLTPEALRQRMRSIRTHLEQSDDPVSAALAARDPLNLLGAVLAELNLTPTGTHRDGPVLVQDNGPAWLLPLRVNFAPNDLTRGEPLIAACEHAVATAPAQVRLGFAGPYRHYVSNQRTIFNDLMTTIPLSLSLISLLLWSLLGSCRAVLVAHTPALASLVGALAGAGGWSLVTGHAVPLPMLGFAAGILGLAVDYGTHVAAHAGGPLPRRELFLGYATTATAFAVLVAAALPGLQVLGVMVVVGLGTALVVALGLMPQWLPPAQPQPVWIAISRWIGASLNRHPRRALLCAGLLSVALLPGLRWLHFADDVRVNDGSDAAVWADLDALITRWGAPDASTFLVSEATDLDQALHQSAAVRAHLGLAPSLVERVLPDRETQRGRLEAWSQRFADPGWRAPLEAAATAHGLRAAGFTANAYDQRTSTRVDLATWDHTPIADALAPLVRHNALGWMVATPIPAHEPAHIAELVAKIPPDSASRIANRRDLGQRLVAVVRHDLLMLGGIIVLAMIVITALGERHWRPTVAIITAPMLALGWTAGILGWAGVALSPFALLAGAMVAGIGIDAAIFCARDITNPRRLAPVLVCTLTTLIGLGTLALARHPVLHHLGVILVVGMTAALITALLIVPALGTRRQI